MHIQFKRLLMGWYHVNRIGKGICLGNVDEVHYNEDFIAKHTPTNGWINTIPERLPIW